MNSWRSHLHRAWQLAGLPGALAAALWLCVAWVWLTDLPALQQERDALMDQVDHLRHQLLASAPSGPSGGASVSAQSEQAWHALWQGLPAQTKGEALQADVLNTARRLGITPASVQFQGGRLQGLDGVWRQRMTVPVEAPYPAVRAWLDQLLRYPNISLDALDVSRTDVMSDRVKARLAISLWWRHDASAALGTQEGESP